MVTLQSMVQYITFGVVSEYYSSREFFAVPHGYIRKTVGEELYNKLNNAFEVFYMNFDVEFTDHQVDLNTGVVVHMRTKPVSTRNFVNVQIKFNDPDEVYFISVLHDLLVMVNSKISQNPNMME